MPASTSIQMINDVMISNGFIMLRKSSHLTVSEILHSVELSGNLVTVIQFFD